MNFVINIQKEATNAIERIMMKQSVKIMISSFEYFCKLVGKWSKLKIGEIQVDGKYPTMNINNCNILFTDDAYVVEF
jgi:hypothetical protein